jgi:hypothetical protein
MTPPTSLSPSAIETKVDMILVTQEEIKTSLKEMKGQCRADMGTVYDRLVFLEKQDSRRSGACETKSTSSTAAIAIVTALFILVQAFFTMWPHVRG